jgi:hypothetical protein
LLQREQRISYRTLKRRFDLDDDYLADLKEELIYANRLAADEEGRVLVWLGDPALPPPLATAPLQAQERPPLAYTPRTWLRKF